MSIPKSRRLDFTEIPVIDLAPLVAGEDDPATVAAISQACRDVGFIYIKNHGIPLALIKICSWQAGNFLLARWRKRNKLS